MGLKDKIIAGFLVLLLAASATAAHQRNKFVKVQAELDRRTQEEKIDEPYKAALAESERRRKELETALALKNKEAAELIASIEGRGKTIKRLNADYKKLLETKPDINEIKGRYEDADTENICAEFTAMGITCESMGG